MPSQPNLDRLRAIKTLPQLAAYLRDELDWPLESDDVDSISFEYTAQELGLSAEYSDIIKEIKQLRPLAGNQPWGIFFVNFEKKRLPVVVMRQILRALVFKKRASANKADRQAWQPHDLLFISAYGEDTDRAITLAHFVEQAATGLAELRVLGWDDDDTPLHMDYVVRVLHEQLHWDEQLAKDPEAWRARWSQAFLLRHRHVVRTSEELAEQLAALARRIRARIRTILRMEDGFGEMRKLQRAFQKCLIHDLDDEGFADMFAQTVTYGLFSVSVRRTFPGEGTAVSKDDVPNLIFTSPFLKDMLGVFLGLKSRKGKIDFDDLGISDITDFLTSPDTHMEVVLADFNNKTRGEDPVIHFYEHFLSAYNKQLKIQRGVFYTPQPVVSYIVRSVHELLQTEFGLADGLADTTTWGEMIARSAKAASKAPPSPGGEGRGEGERVLKLPLLTDEPGEKRTISPDEPFVQILDPATGTATFLVEVIEVIFQHLKAKWAKGGLAAMPKLSPLDPRPSTFEAYWNLYVPAALLPRLHAFELMMAPYAIAHMKIGLKLAETGYHFASDERARIYLTNALEPKVKQLPNFGFEALAHEAAAVNEIKWYKRFTVVIGNPPYSIQSQNLTDTARAWADPYRYLDGELIREKGALQFEKALQDDCVKFASFSQRRITESSTGVFGFIMSHSFVDNPTLRGMRQSLGQTFNAIKVLDLHGNSTKKERCPDGSEDKNVFDIKQGVGILIATRRGEPAAIASVRYGEAWGTRESKYARLLKTSTSSTEFQKTQPVSPDYLFKPQNADAREEFNNGVKVTEVFIKGNVGIITARDNLVIDFEPGPLVARATLFRDSRQSDENLCETLQISLKKGWDIGRAREQMNHDKNLARFVKPLCYRPFDSRLIFYHPSLVWGMSYPTMQHMLPGGNLAMMVGRSGQVIGQDEWDILFCTRGLTEFNLYRRGGHNLLPLYLVPEEGGTQGELVGHRNWRPNFSLSFLRALATALRLPQKGAHGLPEGVAPEDIFHYAYGTFYSPGYRSRYAEFLKIDFPRLPLTASLELFRALARLGGELVALHLLESSKLDKPITEFVSPTLRNPHSALPTVEKVTWSKNTVWLDKAQTTGFKGVHEDVWNFHIGGYQVCEKWLKDRKGRRLTADDRAHYQKIVVALSETIRLMKEIDQVIDKHGGWPLK